MNLGKYGIGLALCAGITLSAIRVPALAGDAAMAAHVDCAKASSMMASGGAAPEMHSSGDVDKDFAHRMLIDGEGVMALVKVEMACGKDAKTQNFAQHLVDQQREELEQIRLLTSGGG